MMIEICFMLKMVFYYVMLATDIICSHCFSCEINHFQVKGELKKVEREVEVIVLSNDGEIMI